MAQNNSQFAERFRPPSLTASPEFLCKRREERYHEHQNLLLTTPTQIIDMEENGKMANDGRVPRQNVLE